MRILLGRSATFLALAMAIAGCNSTSTVDSQRSTASAGSGLSLYPIVGRFSDTGDTFVGASVDNLIEGTYPLRARSRQSGIYCDVDASAPPLQSNANACAAQTGTVQFSCDNGRTVEVTWQAESCATGYGSSTDTAGNRFDFSFGLPRTVALEHFDDVNGVAPPELASIVTPPANEATENFSAETEVSQAIEPGLTVEEPQTGSVAVASAAAIPSVEESQPTIEEPQTSADDFWDNLALIGNGTGFFVTNDGYLLTNNHVIGDAEFIVVQMGKDFHEARIKELDPANDLALLKIDAATTPLPLPPQPSYERGGEVMTLGYPFGPLTGYSQKATFGRINDLSGLLDDERLLQMDVPIQPGNSGGPLFNTKGEVIGIVASSLDGAAILDAAGTVPQNMNFAVKADYARPLVANLDSPTTPVGSATDLSFAELSQRYEQSVVLVLIYQTKR